LLSPICCVAHAKLGAFFEHSSFLYARLWRSP
jgi:hypothetical protein